MNTSWSGIRFICRQEAFVDHAYRDGGTDEAPRYSIGFGSQMPVVKPDDTIAIEDAIWRVREHVRLNDESLRSHIKVPLLQSQWDAISSLLYQKWAAHEAVFLKVNADPPNPLWFKELIGWDQNSRGESKIGLTRRRVREMKLIIEGDYGEISEYQVFDGVPLTFKEMRPFPAEEAIGWSAVI